MPTNYRYTEHCLLAPVPPEKLGFDDENWNNTKCNDEDQREIRGANQCNFLLLVLPALSTEHRLIWRVDIRLSTMIRICQKSNLI